MEVVCNRKTGLFPQPGEIKFRCDCPDSAVMCKHVASVLYGVGARLDLAPEKLFELRGVNHEELVDLPAAGKKVAAAGGSRRRIAPSGLADVFGIDLAEAGEIAPPISKEKGAPSAKELRLRAAPPPVIVKVASVKAPALPRLKGAVEVAQPGPSAPLFPKRLTGSLILKWRGLLGETQLQFAARIGVSGSCISQWEKKLRQALQMRDGAREALKKAWIDTH
jgi:hypothetical protein